MPREPPKKKAGKVIRADESHWGGKPANLRVPSEFELLRRKLRLVYGANYNRVEALESNLQRIANSLEGLPANGRGIVEAELMANVAESLIKLRELESALARNAKAAQGNKFIFERMVAQIEEAHDLVASCIHNATAVKPELKKEIRGPNIKKFE